MQAPAMHGDDASAKKIIQDYWCWRASSFDRGSCARQPAWWEVYGRALGCSGPCSILDIGTGTGFLALGLARRGHRVTGIDLSPGMLKRARENAAEGGLPVELLIADAEQPPFRPESFDAVVCRNLLWTLCRPEAALTSWRRLLRPGGRLVVSDGLWSHAGMRGSVRRMLQAVRGVVTRPGAETVSLRFWEAYQRINGRLPHFRGVARAEAAALLEGCGLQDVRGHEHLFPAPPYPGPAGRSFFVLSARKP